jgi:ribonuclease BN (tRNA processing enzyme)
MRRKTAYWRLAECFDPPNDSGGRARHCRNGGVYAIGEIAKKANVRKLLLSHLSPATEEMHDAVLKSIQQNFTGPVSMAADGMRLQP